MQESSREVPQWQQLQDHLAMIIAEAKEQKLCPKGWGQHWGQPMCELLLEQRPLGEWLALTAEHVGLSRSTYFPLKAQKKAVQGWKPFYLPPAEDEDEWERKKQEDEQTQQAEMFREQMGEING